MGHQNSDFSEEDFKKIKTLGKSMRGINTPLVDEAKTCKKAFRFRKKSRGKLREATVNSLIVAYKVFIRSECDDDNRDAFMEALGIKEALKTSGKRLNAVIKATTTIDRQYASKLANIIKFAIQEKIAVDGLGEFIAGHGGIAKCVQGYRASIADDEEETESADSLPQFIKVKISDDTLIATIQAIIEEVKKTDQKRSKDVELCFYANGVVNGGDKLCQKAA